MGWTWDSGWWVGMGAAMVVWLVVTVLIVWLVVRALVGPERSRGEPPRRQEPEDVLRERFARGEIDGDEYQRSLELLRSSR